MCLCRSQLQYLCIPKEDDLYVQTTVLAVESNCRLKEEEEKEKEEIKREVKEKEKLETKQLQSWPYNQDQKNGESFSRVIYNQ